MPKTVEPIQTPIPNSRFRITTTRLVGYATLAWLGMVLLALLNATLRELLITPTVGAYTAHVISTGTLLVLLGILFWVYFRRLPHHTTTELALIGIYWAGLTVAFELLFGHYVAGDSWSELIALYDLTQGYVWILVPVFVLIAPLVFGRYLTK